MKGVAVVGAVPSCQCLVVVEHKEAVVVVRMGHLLHSKLEILEVVCLEVLAKVANRCLEAAIMVALVLYQVVAEDLFPEVVEDHHLVVVVEVHSSKALMEEQPELVVA